MPEVSSEQLESLTGQVVELVESARGLNESYQSLRDNHVIPAVVGLLGGYTDIIATAMSDDVWAEHAWKWDAPNCVIAAARTNRVTLYDATKPSLPIWREYQTGGTSGSMSGHVLAPNASITSIALCGDMLIVGKDEATGNWYSGLFVLSHAENCAYRWKYGAASKYNGALEQANDDLGFSGHHVKGLREGGISEDQHINSVAAFIADGAPVHPITGVPMPTIGLASDGGVNLLEPDGDGYWSIDSHVYQWGTMQSVHFEHGSLIASRSYNGMTWDISALAPGVSLSGEGLISLNNLSVGSGASIHPANMISGGTPISSKGVFGRLGTSALSVFHANPSRYSGGMVAHVSDDYTTPYLPGDVHCALLCDGEEGVIVGGELVSGGYAAQVGYDTIVTEVSTSSLTLQGQSSSQTRGYVNIPTVVGETYMVFARADGWDITVHAHARDGSGGTGATIAQTVLVLGKLVAFSFVATTAASSVLFVQGSAGASADISGVSVRKAAADRSGRNSHAIINGTLNRSKPAGSDIAVWSGFSGTNNLNPSPHSGDDLCASFVARRGAGGDTELLTIADSLDGGSPATGIHLWGASSDQLKLAGNGIGTIVSDVAPIGKWIAISVIVEAGNAFVWVDGALVLEHLSGNWDVSGNVYLGDGFYSTSVARDIGLFTLTGTVPSRDQIRDMHRIMKMQLEKPSFLTGSVRAVTHDSVRNQDWVACSDNQIHRYDGPVIMESVTVPAEVGTISSLAVNDGDIVVGGSGGVWSSQAAKNLRAPVIQKVKSVQPFELGEGDGSITDFYLPYGWKPVRAYVDGSKKRKGAQDDWTAEYDGYRWFIRFAVAPGAVDIDCDATEV